MIYKNSIKWSKAVCQITTIKDQLIIRLYLIKSNKMGSFSNYLVIYWKMILTLSRKLLAKMDLLLNLLVMNWKITSILLWKLLAKMDLLLNLLMVNRLIMSILSWKPLAKMNLLFNMLVENSRSSLNIIEF